MSADGGNLVGAAPSFREPAACRLAEPMRRAMFRQSSRFTPFAETFAEMVAAVWLAGRSDKEGQMLARRGGEHLGKRRMHWDHQRRPGLFLAHRDRAILHVLAAHLDHIAASLRRVEQQRERETRLRANRMTRLE